QSQENQQAEYNPHDQYRPSGVEGPVVLKLNDFWLLRGLRGDIGVSRALGDRLGALGGGGLILLHRLIHLQNPLEFLSSGLIRPLPLDELVQLLDLLPIRIAGGPLRLLRLRQFALLLVQFRRLLIGQLLLLLGGKIFATKSDLRFQRRRLRLQLLQTRIGVRILRLDRLSVCFSRCLHRIHLPAQTRRQRALGGRQRLYFRRGIAELGLQV